MSHRQVIHLIMEFEAWLGVKFINALEKDFIAQFTKADFLPILVFSASYRRNFRIGLLEGLVIDLIDNKTLIWHHGIRGK